MIKVKFFVNKPKGKIEVTVKGHANAAEKGEDLICAGASVLSLTLLQVFRTMENMKFFNTKIRANVKEGYTKLVCSPKTEYYDTVLNSVVTIKTGFDVLCTMYPDFIEFE